MHIANSQAFESVGVDAWKTHKLAHASIIMYGSRDVQFFWTSSARVHSDSRRSSPTVAESRRSSPTVADPRPKNSRNEEKVR